jgi:CHAT domain-containing protein
MYPRCCMDGIAPKRTAGKRTKTVFACAVFCTYAATVRPAEPAPPTLDEARQSNAAGRYEEALEISRLRRALAGVQAGPYSTAALEAALVEAQSLYFLGQFDEALETARAVHAARARDLGPAHPETLRALNTIASTQLRRGETDEAARHYRFIVENLPAGDRAIQAFRLQALSNLGVALSQSGDRDAGERFLQQALHERTLLLGPDDPATLATARSLAQTQLLRGRLSEALSLAEQWLPGHRRRLGEAHPDTLALETRRAEILIELGRFDEAHAALSAASTTLGERLGPGHPLTVQARWGRTLARLFLGEQENILEELRSLQRDRGERTDPDAFNLRYTVVFVLLKSGRVEEASAEMEETARLAATVFPDDHPQRLTLDAGLGRVQLLRGDAAGAVRTLERVVALKRARFGAEHSETLWTTALLARAQLEAGQVEASERSLEQLVRGAEAQRQANPLPAELRRSALARWADEDFQTAGYKTLVRIRARRGDAAGALEASERVKARTLVDQLTGAWASANGEAAWTGGIDNAIDVRAAARRLDRDTAFLSYVVDGDAVVALVLEPNGRAQAVDVGSLRGLRDTVEAMRRLASSPLPRSEPVWRLAPAVYRHSLSRPSVDAQRTTDIAPLARELGAALLGPVAGTLRPYRRLLIAPDGALALLPFDLLESGGRRLAEDYAVSLTQSLTIAIRPRAVHRATQGILLVGDVPYGAAAQLPALPGTADEIASIARLFPRDKVRRLGGSEARVAEIRRLAEAGTLARYRYLHVAAHAVFDPEQAARSAILLDVPFSAKEISTLRLESDLVILSACETGRGIVQSGEGLLGLPHALALAGSRWTLLSLWPVSDAGSRDFMVSLYRRLVAGASPAGALRETKLEFARSRGPWSQPRHWAPYVLYGAQ